jgi:hypothetical protein
MARFYNPVSRQRNFVQTIGTKTSIASSASLPAVIISANITTRGNPVEIFVTGDAENQSSGSWVRIKLFRDNTEIGNVIWAESSASSENVPYTLHFIDSVAAGTYTYSAKVVAISGGNWNFGETDGPIMTVIEI